MDMGPMPPAFRWTHLWQWHLGWVPCVLLLVALAAYLAGVARLPSWSVARTVCFVAGITATFLATQSVLGVYDMVLFSDHMVQHLALIMVAAPLFAASAPLDLASAALRGRAKQAVDGFIDGPVGGVVLHPAFGFLCYAAFIPATHLSGIMNLDMEHLWLHHLEQVAFLVVGYLFFRHVFGIERGPVQLHPGLRLVFLMVAVPVDTFTGLALDMTSHNPFPVYDVVHRPWGPTVLADVHLGGAIMWIGGDFLMLLAMIPATVLWVRYEDQKTKELDTRLDAERAAAAAAAAD
jgi:putative copper resistance protein D